MFGEKGENGVSMPHVLGMRPYAQIPTKYARKGHLMKSYNFSQCFKQTKQINTLCTSSYLNP